MRWGNLLMAALMWTLATASPVQRLFALCGIREESCSAPVRLLMDAGADTKAAIRERNPGTRRLAAGYRDLLSRGQGGARSGR